MIDCCVAVSIDALLRGRCHVAARWRFSDSKKYWRSGSAWRWVSLVHVNRRSICPAQPSFERTDSSTATLPRGKQSKILGRDRGEMFDKSHRAALAIHQGGTAG